jgi:hypothetical protein
MTALFDAVVTKDTERARTLLQEGASVNDSNPLGQTPLHLAAKMGATEIVSLLIDHGADVKAVDQWGNSPMWGAVFESRQEVIRILRDRGADPLIDGSAQFARAARPNVATLFGDLPDSLPAVVKARRGVLADGEIPLAARPGERVRISDESNRLWKLLVPPSGPAPTLQGEVIRACGRLAREGFGNGNFNWGRPFEEMCDFLATTIADEATFEAAEVNEIRGVIATIRIGERPLLSMNLDPRDSRCPYNVLTSYGVKWCLLNRKLVPYDGAREPLRDVT